VRPLTSEQLIFGCELGEGGFGRIIQAQLNGKDVAVKQLLRPSMHAFAEFRKELHYLARAQGSEHIVKLVGAVYYGPVCYMLVTELCRGGTLDKFVVKSGASTPEIVALLDDARCGIAYLHQRNIMHRDIKPPNILVNPRSQGNRARAKVSDMGLAITLPEDGVLFVQSGTPGFRAPEIGEDAYSLPADVFAYGRTAAYIFSTIKVQRPDWVNQCCRVHPKLRPNLQTLTIKKLCRNAEQGCVCPWRANCWYDHSAPVFVTPAMEVPSSPPPPPLPIKDPIKVELNRPSMFLYQMFMQEMQQLAIKNPKGDAASETRRKVFQI
jgi:serine/threonine protein kinase